MKHLAWVVALLVLHHPTHATVLEHNYEAAHSLGFQVLSVLTFAIHSDEIDRETAFEVLEICAALVIRPIRELSRSRGPIENTPQSQSSVTPTTTSRSLTGEPLVYATCF